jgi:flavin-dependent dehydrogenase
LVGNAAGFLDPIFSSGVSLALESAVLAAGLVGRELAGERVVWAQDYDSIMDRSVDVFRAFVESWYRGDLEEIFFHDEQPDHYRRSITSILAGQVQRRENPLVRAPGPTLDRLMYLITKPK